MASFLTFRSLLRSPALALGVGAMLAVGVGALTVTFGIVNAALFREPPFEDARRLAALYIVRNPIGEPPQQRQRWSYSRYELLREGQRSFELVANYSNPSLTLSGTGEAELVRGEMVSASYFPLLRVRALIGRTFAESEDEVARPTPVVLLSHTLWRRRFAADSTLVGRAIRVNGTMLTVIGILPQDFHGLSGRADIWMPSTMAPQLTYADYVRTNQNFISVVGRLRDGVSLLDARSELSVLGASINRTIPSDPAQPNERVTATAMTLNQARVDPAVRRSLVVLLSAVALLHLLACANVTNLLLGRAAKRRRDAAVRLAMGSSAGRLFRHLLGEYLALAVPAALFGVLLAWWTSTLLTPPTNVWAARNFYGSLAAFDTAVFGRREAIFGIALAIVTAFLVAIPAALSAFKLDVYSEIRSGSQGIASGAIRLRRPTLRGVIVALEASLAVLLVVSAGLLIDSFQRMRQTRVGADTSNVLTFWIIPSEARIPAGGGSARYVSRVLDAMARVPGVVSASVDGGAPLAGTARGLLYIVGQPIPPAYAAPPVLRHYVSPNHFRTLGISLKRGRVFTDGDVEGSPKVTVISEGAAQQFWPNEDPIGKRVWFAGSSAFGSPDSSAEIVGIVSDVMYEPLDRQPNRASFYTPYTQFTYASRMVFLRTSGDPLAIVPAARTALQSVDPDVAMRDVQTLDEIVNGSWARTRFEARLFGGFGIAALLLAASGIFAVLAYAVASRTREFGVRIALGADRGHVMRVVLGEGLAFPVIGMLVGVAAAFPATRVLRSSLYEVSPLEPRVFAGTVVLLLIAAVVACLIPAWRATRANPMEAIRAE
ncbi:MAG TPA: ABC transporter permease [Gemmatimonadaceae bacterium]|nr:ABC transporter permease [Gemmatimonadaceae bacterium]